MNTWILFLQVFLISAGAVSLVVGILFTVPMAVNQVQAIWSVILPWLRPPYLHILINAIIITIAAASRFRENQPELPPPVQSQLSVSVRTPPPAYHPAFTDPPAVGTVADVPSAVEDGEDGVVELKAVMVNGLEVDTDEDEETTAVGAFCHRTPERFSPEFQLGYIVPVKPTRNVPERVREMEHETLESTWKKIIEETTRVTSKATKEVQHMELQQSSLPNWGTMSKSKSLKERIGVKKVKHETLDGIWKKIMDGASRATYEAPQDVQHMRPPRSSLGRDNMLKSKSFTERISNQNSLIRKEKSPNQDELNQRVDAFIKKVYDDMRLERQESLTQQLDMIKTGV